MNSIGLIFEQCGGKYSIEKKSAAEVEAERLAAIEAGADPDQLPEEEEWVWVDPGCVGCDLGFARTPEEEAAFQEEKERYEDCVPTDVNDRDCVEYWDINC